MRVLNTGEGNVCLYSVGDIAKKIGITRAWAWERIKTYKSLPAPTYYFNNRLFYLQSEFDSILSAEIERKSLLKKK